MQSWLLANTGMFLILPPNDPDVESLRTHPYKEFNKAQNDNKAFRNCKANELVNGLGHTVKLSLCIEGVGLLGTYLYSTL